MVTYHLTGPNENFGDIAQELVSNMGLPFLIIQVVYIRKDDPCMKKVPVWHVLFLETGEGDVLSGDETRCGGNESTDFPEILHLELIDFVIDLVKETSTCTNLCRVILNHSLCVG